MATYELSAQVDIVDLLDDVSYSEEGDVLLELLERFTPKNVNAALREYFEDKKRTSDGSSRLCVLLRRSAHPPCHSREV